MPEPDYAGGLVLGKYAPIYGAAYEGEIESPDHLEVRGQADDEFTEKLYGFHVGPILSAGQVYNTDLGRNLYAAINKNLADQLPGRGLSTATVDEFVEENLLGIGAQSSVWTPDIRLYTEDEVLAAAQDRSHKKFELYRENYVACDENGCERSMNDTWELNHFVKFEYLGVSSTTGLPKPPRLIANVSTEDVVQGRRSGKGFEKFIEKNLSIKGLKSAERYKPLEEVHDLLGDFYVVALDDTARDANSVRHDFNAYKGVLGSLGLLTPYMAQMLDREGFSSRCKGLLLRTRTTSLLSGSDFTSAMNYNTTRLNCWYIAKVCGLVAHEWCVVAEGDDCLMCITKDAWLRIQPDFSNTFLPKAASDLRKQLKVEGEGWFDECGHPFVGGNVGYYAGRWWYFPSLGRMRLKATVVLGKDVHQPTNAKARVRARVDALLDRYTGVPIGWKLAEVLQRHASWVGRGKILRNQDEEHNQHSRNDLPFKPPTMLERQAFEHVMGVAISTQLALEDLIECETRTDINVDLTSHFNDLLG